ncbi:ankyrin repeat and protein kinase domain-containing protein 1-like isoform X1 [Schistocerca nitens]|uniref:ankyrin repeat and protein kinase domain-containing protein 1-like isoform X1 n=1 Tax=Schistocerca nitens TaxID=7011 RepID=UPI0021190C68|nr:ankyrin repeat and protein kinase domain-containing protein 1-like isoform X1 [Schistocerca nitens]XP_049795922.1 ankyrin repeat and protein kinase domain-containing protein 1-like isoform X1 [Schistocerca nitens]XP_049795923.1 ankyrin repeat and protein kinase domain-containing protein 1-like isoform X1 [Schistocerca nitens]XP_049795924.1 ankyrin repeat and protein kinase domain-containing protein 1-like isoform X1 [Schistocerca nitens]
MRKSRGASRTPPLSVAVRAGDVNAVRKLLREGESPNDFDNRGWTPLHEAAAGGHVTCALLLLHFGQDIKDVITHEGETPLFLSVNPDSKPDVIKVLLNHSADMNLGNNERSTPLHKACELDLVDRAHLLLESGADINAANNNHSRPIHEAIKRKSVEMVNLLVKFEADLSLRDSDGRTPIMTAAYMGFHEVLKKLNTPDLNIINESQFGESLGDTALMLAVRRGCLKTVEVLLEMGADANIVREDTQQTALHLAARRGDPRIVELIIKATEMEKVALCKNPLINAIESMQVKTIELLLEWMHAHPHLVRKVIECESGVFAQDYKVTGPLSYLLYYKADHKELLPVLHLLLKNGCPANVSSINEFPPLTAITASSAPKRIKKECIEILLDYGADADHPFPWYAKMYPLSFLPAAWYYALRLHPDENWLIRLLMSVSKKCDPNTLLSVVYVYACYKTMLVDEELCACRSTLQHTLDLALELGPSDYSMMFSIWAKFRKSGLSGEGLTGEGVQNQQEETAQDDLIVPEMLTPTPLAKLCRILVRKHYSLSALRKYDMPSIVNDFLNYMF